MKRPATLINVFIGFVAIVLFGTAFFSPIHAGDPPSRETTKRNLVQCATALMLYSADYDEHLPNAYRWMSATWPYLQDAEAYRDPWNPESRSPTNPAVPESGRYGIAFFLPLSEADQSKIEEPYRQIRLFTSSHLGWNATSGLESVKPTADYQGRKFWASFVQGLTRSVSNDSDGVDRKTGRLK
ncbi:MAG: hypothetical protein KF784_14195 [Fimbriimonadaceae bacterium]|nr:hypothetical protein [Fimbriimonadaceae bacterium]